MHTMYRQRENTLVYRVSSHPQAEQAWASPSYNTSEPPGESKVEVALSTPSIDGWGLEHQQVPRRKSSAAPEKYLGSDAYSFKGHAGVRSFVALDCDQGLIVICLCKPPACRTPSMNIARPSRCL